MSVFDRIPAPLRRSARKVLGDERVDAMRDGIIRRYYAPGMVSRSGPVAYRFRRYVLRRPPRLHRVVVHITDHCNLNCRGCTHFSNIAKPAFADLDEFTRDFTRLARLFPDITEIYLLGGEPLLHPQLESFVRVTRRLFPDSRINLMSNAVLVPKMDEAFWQMLIDTDAWLVCDLYPAKIDVERVERLAAEHGVKFEWVEPRGEFFKLPIDPTGSQDAADSFARCRTVSNCPILRHGRLYPCAYIAYIDLFEERFETSGLEAGCEDSVSIYDTDDAYKVMDFLLSPVPWCSHCDFDRMEQFDWARTERTPEEWLVTSDAACGDRRD